MFYISISIIVLSILFESTDLLLEFRINVGKIRVNNDFVKLFI